VNQTARMDQLEKRVADLEKQVAAATTTNWDPQRAAELMQKASKKIKRQRGVAY
jgi:tetrahydromethanopterin S-methyltransferase subunit G